MGMTIKIKMLLAKRGMTISELASRMGTSQSNLSNKLKRDNFTEQDLLLIAEILGASYKASFHLDDGTEI